MKNLEQDGCITRGVGGQLLLTEKGWSIAHDTLERHRFLTEFFVSIGVSQRVAEDDACGMEHSISKETFDHLRTWYASYRQAKPEEHA